MNKIVTGITGLMPFYQEDIEFIQNAFANIAEGIASIFGDNYILSGCEWSAGTGGVTFMQGWMVINGEIVFFPEQTIQLKNPTAWYGEFLVKTLSTKTEEREFEIADSSGEKLHKVWEIKTAIFSDPTDGSDPEALEISFHARNWLNAIKAPEKIYEYTESGAFGIKLYKDISGKISGFVKLTNDNFSYVRTFPAKYAPKGTTLLFSDMNGRVEIRNDGNCQIAIIYDNSTGADGLILPVNYQCY